MTVHLCWHSITLAATLPAQRNPPRTNSGSRTQVQRRPMPSRTLHGPWLEVIGLRGGQFLCFYIFFGRPFEPMASNITFQQGLATIWPATKLTFGQPQIWGKPTHPCLCQKKKSWKTSHCLQIGEFITRKKVNPTSPSYSIPWIQGAKTNRSNTQLGSGLRII